MGIRRKNSRILCNSGDEWDEVSCSGTGYLAMKRLRLERWSGVAFRMQPWSAVWLVSGSWRKSDWTKNLAER